LTQLLAGPEASLLELVSLESRVEAALIDEARRELLARRPPEGDHRWGFLLGVEEAARTGLPAASKLDERLRASVIEPLAERSGRAYALSFLKAAEGPPPAASEGVHYDGFHLDTHPELDGERGVELARVLINLSREPRRFRFAAIDRRSLAEGGVRVHRGDYQVVELPGDVEVRTIEIPGRTDSGVHALRFWASVVPHVGADDERGHFLASYEALAPYPGAP
jgi:hypothetical protein